MKGKILRIENPFATRPQRQLNLRRRILVAEGGEENEHLTPALLPILLSQNAERETRSQRFPESGHRPLVAADKDSVKLHPFSEA